MRPKVRLSDTANTVYLNLVRHLIYPPFANSVDPDQLTSEEVDWSGSTMFVIKYLTLYEQSGSSNQGPVVQS